MHTRNAPRAAALALAALVTASVLGGIAEIADRQHVTAMSAPAPATAQVASSCTCQRKG